MTQSYDYNDFDEATERARVKLIDEKYRKRHIDSLTSVFIEVCNSLEEKGVNRDKPGFIIAAAELTSVYFDQVPR